ncbi:uncharacterized protein TNCT_117881 [Trichonephila clavata]|uniref:Uncharacterized protein n=1 Tax=Trichonephila clavata TaxID=2740835 RepID=A0A8X6KC75_TRICU|nr:uncharacterized protein TNCT_117881 [Trichonephila clavata]
MFFVMFAICLFSGVFSQQTEGGTNVIFARPSRSNTSDEVSGQNYQNAHLVFVTESNRGVIQQREARTEMARFQCETRNPCAFQPYTLNGLDRELGPIHMSVCYCSPDKVCTRHRDKLISKMFEFLCYPLPEETTVGSTVAV